MDCVFILTTIKFVFDVVCLRVKMLSHVALLQTTPSRKWAEGGVERLRCSEEQDQPPLRRPSHGTATGHQAELFHGVDSQELHCCI